MTVHSLKIAIFVISLLSAVDGSLSAYAQADTSHPSPRRGPLFAPTKRQFLQKEYRDSLNIPQALADSLVSIEWADRTKLLNALNKANYKADMGEEDVDRNEVKEIAVEQLKTIKTILSPDKFDVYLRLQSKKFVGYGPHFINYNYLKRSPNVLKTKFIQTLHVSNNIADSLVRFANIYNQTNDQVVARSKTLKDLRANTEAEISELNANVHRVLNSAQYKKWLDIQQNNFPK